MTDGALPPGDPDPRRRRWATAWGLALAALAALFAADHLAWVRADVLPVYDGDTVHHATTIVERWWALTHDGPTPMSLYPPGTYPPLVAWSSWLGFLVAGASIDSLRATQAVFTAAWTAGFGLLVGRAWGRTAGLAAAAACLTFPALWPQRTVVLLTLPQAGLTALAFALLPVPDEPGRRVRSALGGLVMAGATLTHVSMVYWLVPTALVQLGLAAWGLARGRPGARAHAGDVALTYGAVGLLAVPWYLWSLPILRQSAAGNYAQPTWAHPAVDHLVLLAWLKNHFLYAPHAWALAAGLLALPFVPRRPLLVPVIAGLLGGWFGLLSYPHFQARYFLPLLPLLAVIMTAPFGLPDRWAPRSRAAALVAGLVATAIAAWGVRFTLGWRDAPAGPATLDPSLDGAIHHERLARMRAEVRADLLRVPTRAPTHGMVPHQGRWPIDTITRETAETLGLRRPERGPPSPRADDPALIIGHGPFVPDTLGVELVARGWARPRIVEHRGVGRAIGDADCARETCWVLTTRAPTDTPPARTWAIDVPETGADRLYLFRTTGPAHAHLPPPHP